MGGPALDHKGARGRYGADPDGNEFEIMWMLPREEWGEFEHATPTDRLDLDAEVKRWSGVHTGGLPSTPPRGRPEPPK